MSKPRGSPECRQDAERAGLDRGLHDQTEKAEKSFRNALEAILRAVETLVQSVSA